MFTPISEKLKTLWGSCCVIVLELISKYICTATYQTYNQLNSKFSQGHLEANLWESNLFSLTPNPTSMAGVWLWAGSGSGSGYWDSSHSSHRAVQLPLSLQWDTPTSLRLPWEASRNLSAFFSLLRWILLKTNKSDFGNYFSFSHTRKSLLYC